MYKYLLGTCLALCLLACGTTRKASNTQPTAKIDFAKKTLSLNGHKLDRYSKLFQLTNILGKYDRTLELGSYYAYYFDQAGILMLEGKESRLIEEISFQYAPQRGKKKVHGSFTGKVILDGKEIKQLPSVKAVKQALPNILFRSMMDVVLITDELDFNLVIAYIAENQPELVTVAFVKPAE